MHSDINKFYSWIMSGLSEKTAAKKNKPKAGNPLGNISAKELNIIYTLAQEANKRDPSGVESKTLLKTRFGKNYQNELRAIYNNNRDLALSNAAANLVNDFAPIETSPGVTELLLQRVAGPKKPDFNEVAKKLNNQSDSQVRHGDLFESTGGEFSDEEHERVTGEVGKMIKDLEEGGGVNIPVTEKAIPSPIVTTKLPSDSSESSHKPNQNSSASPKQNKATAQPKSTNQNNSASPKQNKAPTQPKPNQNSSASPKQNKAPAQPKPNQNSSASPKKNKATPPDPITSDTHVDGWEKITGQDDDGKETSFWLKPPAPPAPDPDAWEFNPPPPAPMSTAKKLGLGAGAMLTAGLGYYLYNKSKKNKQIREDKSEKVRQIRQEIDDTINRLDEERRQNIENLLYATAGTAATGAALYGAHKYMNRRKK
jgi:hypothetical protein